MLAAPPNVSSPMRRDVAAALLGADDILLENTTLKFKKLFADDLAYSQETGQLRTGSGLHGVLCIVAMNLKLDSGALESLNSMIRQAVNISRNNRMSLELLSSRVNMRKTITTQANGATKLREVKPVAAKLAASCLLYQEHVTSVLDDEHRWAPPQPAFGQYSPGKPELFDPGSVLTKEQQWAFKFHRLVMKSVDCCSKEHLLMGFTLRCHHGPQRGAVSASAPDITEAFVVGEMTKRSCQVLKLVWTPNRGREHEAFLKVPFKFVNSLDVLAERYDVVKAYKPGIQVNMVHIKYADRIPGKDGGTNTNPFIDNQLRLEIVGTGESHTIKYRKEYVRKPKDIHVSSQPGDIDQPLGMKDGGEDNNDVRSEGSEMSIDSLGAMEELAQLEQELRGEFSDDDDVDGDGDEKDPTEIQETTRDTTETADENDVSQNTGDNDAARLLTSMEQSDFQDMQNTNFRLTAAAASLQEQTTFCNLENLEVPDGVRPYDDEMGEVLFSEYINQSANGAGGQSSFSRESKQSLPQPCLSPAVMELTFNQWSVAAQRSAQSCQEVSRACDQFDVDSISAYLGHELSLVLHEDANNTMVADLVSWVPPYNKLRGRAVKLDTDDCVIYPSRFIEKQTFSPCVMVLHMVGARVRKQSREHVPPYVLHTRSMLEAAADGIFGASWELDPATVCAGCKQPEGNNNSNPMCKCSFCLLFWHKGCSEQLGRRLVGLLRTHNVPDLNMLDLTPEVMPFIFWSLDVLT